MAMVFCRLRFVAGPRHTPRGPARKRDRLARRPERARGSRRLRGEGRVARLFGGAGEEEAALAVVAREGGGALELAARLVATAEPREEIAAHARQEVVAGEAAVAAQRVDELEAGGRSLRHRDGDGAVEVDDRRG